MPLPATLKGHSQAEARASSNKMARAPLSRYRRARRVRRTRAPRISDAPESAASRARTRSRSSNNCARPQGEYNFAGQYQQSLSGRWFPSVCDFLDAYPRAPDYLIRSRAFRKLRNRKAGVSVRESKCCWCKLPYSVTAARANQLIPLYL